MNLKEALLKAYAEQGAKPPAEESNDSHRTVLATGPNRQAHAVQVTYGPSVQRPRTPANLRPANSRPPAQAPRGAAAVNAPTGGSVRDVQQPATRPGASRSAADAVQVTRVVQRPLAAVSLGPDSRCLVSSSVSHAHRFLDLKMTHACKESIEELVKPEIHEMALGLDFGTSSVKLVISDLAADKAYAVPFFVANGIDAYLLPSRVFEVNPQAGGASESVFSLVGGELAFRDLKLSLLAEPDSESRQVEVIAFLALVIQRARAWFFNQHHSIYKQVKCLWQLRIGLPAATALDNQYVPLLENILRAAWKTAAVDEGFGRSEVRKFRDSVFALEQDEEEPEVRVIPEIAAQIFGFVVSTSFDAKAANRYLMVDVGAGTVDSSLFKVVPGRGGQWNFEFYTAVVQPYGVANLHAHRVNWWLSKFDGIEKAGGLAQELKATQFATDLVGALPVCYLDYFSGVRVNVNKSDDPDFNFFDKKLMAQVQGSTLWRAAHDNYLDKSQLTNIPMFLCGGGARSPFYLDLEEKLVSLSGFTWLSAEPWQLGYPGDLVSEGIDEKDFDRLSVAYGLSKLNVGTITQAVPLPKVPIETQVSFTDRYVDKDQT